MGYKPIEHSRIQRNRAELNGPSSRCVLRIWYEPRGILNAVEATPQRHAFSWEHVVMEVREELRTVE